MLFRRAIMTAMKYLPVQTVSSVVLVVSLATILLVLAALQYYWTGQVSRAERERMQASLLNAVEQFRQEFNGELQQIGVLFQPDDSVVVHNDWQHYAQSCADSLNVANADLVENVYLWVAEKDDSKLLRLNRQAKDFEAVPWPAKLQAVRERYQRTLSGSGFFTPEVRPFSWTILFDESALLHPLVRFPPSPTDRFVGYLVLELSMGSLRQELLPRLAQKYFAGPEGFIYHVAIVSNAKPNAIVYESEPNLPSMAFAAPDVRTSLLVSFQPFSRRGPARSEGSLPAPRPPVLSLPGAQNRMNAIFLSAEGIRRLRAMLPVQPGNGADWQVVAKHREGSVERAVARLRWRNLGISFGILLLLAVSMALIIASARRAQWLARLQMDFVARVSHELRTPLAVICSAGDNLAEGVIGDSGRQVRQYGELIRTEGRKLTRMVEQVLHFASVQNAPKQYDLKPGRIDAVIDSALEQLQGVIATEGFRVDKSFAPDLPMVNVDSRALSQLIENLIQNALKYSGVSRLIAIRTASALTETGTQIQIVVEDNGIGIDAGDLPYIFEPFYRGRTAKAAEIQGVGLGLFMVREAVVGMGGTINARSSPGKGSVFTISLPALPVDGSSSVATPDSQRDENGIQNIDDRG